MDSINIEIDEPIVEITDEYSTDYELPVASSSTLGGVKIGANISETSDGTISVPIASADTAGVIKVGTNLSIDENGVLSGQAGGSITVDTTLSTVSTNPVQNRVITSEINSTNSNVSSLQSTVEGITDSIEDINEDIDDINITVGNNTSDITDLQSAVETNTGNISTNTENIATNAGNISGLDTRLTTDEGYITDNGNSIATLSGNVTPLLVTFSETAAGTDIDNTIWTGGNVTIFRRGKIGVVTLDLEGTYTLAGSSSKIVYTMVNQDNLPTYVGKGALYTDDGVVYAEFDSDGKLIIYNYGSQNITLSYLMGSIPVIFA